MRAEVHHHFCIAVAIAAPAAAAAVLIRIVLAAATTATGVRDARKARPSDVFVKQQHPAAVAADAGSEAGGKPAPLTPATRSVQVDEVGTVGARARKGGWGGWGAGPSVRRARLASSGARGRARAPQPARLG